MRFLDAQGQPIKLDEKRLDASFKLSGYGMAERLDPGQEATQTMDVAFPATALQGKMLKTIQLELVYLPSSYRQEKVDFPVSIGAP